jgi:site-specific recombinase XerD
MASISFVIVDKGTYSQLYIAIRNRGDLVRKYTGFKVNPKDWDKHKQKLKPQADKASVINSYISDKVSKFDSYVDDCIRSTREPKAQEAMQVISGSTVSHTVRTLSDAFDLYLKKIESSHDRATARKYEIVKDQVVKYESSRKEKVVLNDVTEDFYLDFVKFLLDEQGNANRTILRKLKTIKTVMLYVTKKELHNSMKWNVTVDLKTIDVCRVPLTEDERTAFLNWTTTVLFDRRIIDAFIFGMFTGLRFSDLDQLSSHHFFQTAEGEYFIDLSLEKGDKDHMVGVPGFLYERIKHYLGASGPIFNLTDNATCNDVIKRVAKQLELNREIEWREKRGNKTTKEVFPLHKKISFHFARYTYTRILDDSGIQATWIQKNLRHAKFATTEKYLKADDVKRINETNKKLAL